MVVFRCTIKFAKKFGFRLETDNQQNPTNVLGDWYFNFFTFQRINYILGVSETSLLPVIVTAKEIKTFPERFGNRLAEVLQIIGIDSKQINLELREMQTISYGKTKSKKVLGCQNDYLRMVSYMMRDNLPSTLLDYSLQLSKTPFKPIGYAYPQEICLKLFEQQIT